MNVTAVEGRRAMEILAQRAREENWRKNPDTWYVERFGGKKTDLVWSLWPEYANHEWDGTPDPFYTAFKSLAEWKNVGIESATSTGKTFCAARIAYWFLDTFPNSLVVTTAPKELQLKTVLWGEMSACFNRFKKLRPKAEMFDLRVLPDGSKVKFGSAAKASDDDDQYSDMHQCIGVVAGVKAGEESATKMQGYHRKYMLFIVEEAAGVPQAVMTAIKNTCTGEHNVIMGIGNPDSVTDALHQFCELSHVVPIRISAYDHPNVVTGKTVIDGAVSVKSINIRLKEYGEDSNLFRSRVRGIAPDQSTDSLILLKWVLQCAVNHETYKEIPRDNVSSPAVGVDVANSEKGDAACLAWGDANELTRLHEFQCPNATHLAYNLYMTKQELFENKYHDYDTRKLQDYGINGEHVGIDAVGIGVATVNAMIDKGYNVKVLQGAPNEEVLPKDTEGKPLYKFRSLRAQMWYQARLDLENRAVKLNIPLGDLFLLAKELTMPRYKLSDGAIVLEKKEDVKKRLGKSPNKADAFVYWNWVRRFRVFGFVGEMPIGDVPQSELYKYDEFKPPTEPGEWRAPEPWQSEDDEFN